MNKFRNCVQFWDLSHFFFQEILNRFNVVVSGTLNGFDSRRIFFTEISDDCIKVTDCVGSKSRNFLDRCVRGQLIP